MAFYRAGPWVGGLAGGWSHVASLGITNGRALFFIYRKADGYLSIRSVRPDQQGRWDHHRTRQLTADWTRVIALTAADGRYLLGHNEDNHKTEFHRVADDHSVEPVVSTTWGNGYRILAPFRMGDDAYYVSYNAVNGHAFVDRLNPGGQDSTTVYVKNWTLGWTHYVPFDSSGRQYALGYKTNSGRVAIDEITQAGSNVIERWGGAVDPHMARVVTFTVQGIGRCFLFYSNVTGWAKIYPLEGEALGESIYDDEWWFNTKVTWFMPFRLPEVPGQHCLFYNSPTGKARIDTFSNY